MSDLLGRLTGFTQSEAGQKAMEKAAQGDDAATAEVAAALGLPQSSMRDMLELSRTQKQRQAVDWVLRYLIGSGDNQGTAKGGLTLAQLLCRDTEAGNIDATANIDALKGFIDREFLTQEQGNELLRTIDPRTIRLAPFSESLDSRKGELVALGRLLTDFLVTLKEAHLSAAVVPGLDQQPADGDLYAFVQQGLGERKDSLAQGKDSDPAVADVFRLSMRPTSDFESFMDPRTGRILLAERSEPLSAAVQTQIDPKANEALLREMVTVVGDRIPWEQVTGLLVERMPTSVLEVLRTAEFKGGIIYPSSFYLSDEAEQMNRMLRHVPGLERKVPAYENPVVRLFDQWAATRTPDQETVSGHLNDIRGLAEVGDRWSRAPGHAGTLTHEFMHALDLALGEKMPLSDEAEFLTIYENTKAAREEGFHTPKFPNRNAVSSPDEFFVEAATAYLNLNFRNAKSWCHGTTRAHLRQDNPEAYNYFDRLFSERLPAALAEGRITKVEDWVRDSVGLLAKAAGLFRQAMGDQDPASLDAADGVLRKAAAACEKENRNDGLEDVQWLQQQVAIVRSKLTGTPDS